MMMVNLETVAAVSAGKALNWIVGGIAIALFAEILLRISRRQNSRTRFVVWFAALVGISLLPLAGCLFLTRQVDLVARMHSPFTLPVSWALWLFFGWVLVASISLLRVGFGILQIRRLRKRSVEVAPSFLHPVLRNLLREQASGRKLMVYQSDDVRVPIAVGFLIPAIILPSWTLTGLSTEELNAVLLHEIAHIRRWDDWTNLIQKILGALFFFHPAVWWIENRLALEREMACDDIVLSENSNPRDYANCLVSLAEKSFSRRGVVLAQAAVMRVRHIRRRISQILDVHRSGKITIWKPALGLVALFSILSFFASTHIPQVISFEDATPTLNAAVPSIPLERSTHGGSSEPKVNAHRQTPSLIVNANLRSPQPVASNAAEKPERSLTQKPLLHARTEQKLASRTPLHLIQARATSSRPDTVSSQAYFLVIRTIYPDSGDVFWSIGVVQLTVFHPSRAQAQQESSQKI